MKKHDITQDTLSFSSDDEDEVLDDFPKEEGMFPEPVSLASKLDLVFIYFG